MKTRYDWEECLTCQGKRFVDNRLCPQCGGDGSVLTLAEVEPTMIDLIIALITGFGFTAYFKTVAKQKQKRGMERLTYAINTQ